MDLKATAREDVAARLLDTDDALLDTCFRLRHEFYVQQRKWVVEADPNVGRETDRYDGHALHLATFSSSTVTAYLRVLPYDPDVGFMLDDEFASTLSPLSRRNLPRENAVELSRLVYAKQTGRALQSPHPLELLLRCLYQLSRERGFERYYAVVEEGWLRPFERRFKLPFRPLGEAYTFPDGTRTVAVEATLAELEASVRSRDAAKYAWYQGES